MAKYTAPEMEAILLATADVITTSVSDKGDEGEVVTPGLGGRG